MGIRTQPGRSSSGSGPGGLRAMANDSPLRSRRELGSSRKGNARCIAGKFGSLPPQRAGLRSTLTRDSGIDKVQPKPQFSSLCKPVLRLC